MDRGPKHFSRWDQLNAAQRDSVVQSYYATQVAINNAPTVAVEAITNVIDLTVSDDDLVPHFGYIGEERLTGHNGWQTSGPVALTESVGPFSNFVHLSLDQQANALDGYVIPPIAESATFGAWEERIDQELVIKALEPSDEVLPEYISSSQDSDSSDDTWDPMQVDPYSFSSSQGYSDSEDMESI